MPTNTAAWIGAKQAKLEVRSAPYTPPRDNEIVIKNHAVAVNPIDWIIQVAGNLLYTWVKYPFVLGSDLAGEVVEVGNAVTRFKVGDRILGRPRSYGRPNPQHHVLRKRCCATFGSVHRRLWTLPERSSGTSVSLRDPETYW